jgi:hypothetical protein
MRKAVFFSLIWMTAAVGVGVAPAALAKTHGHAVSAKTQEAAPSSSVPTGRARKSAPKAAQDEDAQVPAPKRGKHGRVAAQKQTDDTPVPARSTAPTKRGRAAAQKAAQADDTPAPTLKRDQRGRVVAQKSAPDDDAALRASTRVSARASGRTKHGRNAVAKAAPDDTTADAPAPRQTRGKHGHALAQAQQTPAADAPPPVRKRVRASRVLSAGTYDDGYRDGFAAALAQMRASPAASAMALPMPLPRSSRAAQHALVEDAGIPSGPTSGTELLEKASYDLRGAMPAPLKGSTASLVRQNTRLSDDGLERIEDEHDLEGRIAHKLLVPVPVSSMLSINQDLPLPRRYCRPWTARFLADIARLHYETFHRPLIVSSAVRTVDYQKRLMGVNGNAAQAVGDIVSPHLTGAAVDLPKDNLSRQEMAWMRRKLQALQEAGKIDVEEEFQQPCFHISVYKEYLELPGAASDILAHAAQKNATAVQTSFDTSSAAGKGGQ